jgi:DHA1 family multidrug resistance protein-like MFS transporter
MNMRRILLLLPDEQWRRNRLAINIAAALVFSGFTFVMPFLPLYVKELGVRGEAAIATWAGLCLTIAPLLASLLAPAWGRIGDRYGMKLMIERAVLALCVHWALLGFAQNVYHLLALRIALGLVGGFATLSMPLLVSSTPKEHMSQSIGILQTVQMISSAVGPIVGGLLADWIGIRKTCTVSAVMMAVALIMIDRLYKDTEPVVSSSAAGAAERSISFRQAAAIPSFGVMIAVLFFVNFVERSFAPVIPLYILTLGTSPKNAAKTAGLIISLGLLAEAISALVLGNRMKRGSVRRLLLWRLSAGALACIPMGLVWETGQLAVLRVALGLLAGGCMVMIYTLGSLAIPRETRATSFSFLASASLLGAAAGPVVAGALTHLSIRAIFLFNGAVFFLLLLYAWKSIGPAIQAAAHAASSRKHGGDDSVETRVPNPESEAGSSRRQDDRTVPEAASGPAGRPEPWPANE